VSDVPSHLQIGRRVECTKNGPFNGKRGNVEDFMADYRLAVVDFGETTLVDKSTFFEPL